MITQLPKYSRDRLIRTIKTVKFVRIKRSSELSELSVPELTDFYCVHLCETIMQPNAHTATN